MSEEPSRGRIDRVAPPLSPQPIFPPPTTYLALSPGRRIPVTLKIAPQPCIRLPHLTGRLRHYKNTAHFDGSDPQAPRRATNMRKEMSRSPAQFPDESPIVRLQENTFFPPALCADRLNSNVRPAQNTQATMAFAPVTAAI